MNCPACKGSGHIIGKFACDDCKYSRGDNKCDGSCRDTPSIKKCEKCAGKGKISDEDAYIYDY